MRMFAAGEIGRLVHLTFWKPQTVRRSKNGKTMKNKFNVIKWSWLLVTGFVLALALSACQHTSEHPSKEHPQKTPPATNAPPHNP